MYHRGCGQNIQSSQLSELLYHKMKLLLVLSLLLSLYVKIKPLWSVNTARLWGPNLWITQIISSSHESSGVFHWPRLTHISARLISLYCSLKRPSPPLSSSFHSPFSLWSHYVLTHFLCKLLHSSPQRPTLSGTLLPVLFGLQQICSAFRIINMHILHMHFILMSFAKDLSSF